MPAPRRHAAFLRGVYPTTCAMPALRAAFEGAGFTDVRTVLGSGNVVFTAAGTPAALATRAEAAMAAALGRSFPTIVRPLAELAALVAADPFADLAVPADAKPVVTFLRAAPRPAPRLPIDHEGVCVARLADRIAFTHYRPHPKGPVFMQVIARAFGDDVTTRTWATVAKVVAAGAAVSAPAAASAARRPAPRSRR